MSTYQIGKVPESHGLLLWSRDVHCHTTGQPVRGREGREGLQMCVYDCCVVRLIPAIIFWSQSLQGLEKLNFREENIGLRCVFF